jgi:hypothetical protein
MFLDGCWDSLSSKTDILFKKRYKTLLQLSKLAKFASFDN